MFYVSFNALSCFDSGCGLEVNNCCGNSNVYFTQNYWIKLIAVNRHVRRLFKIAHAYFFIAIYSNELLTQALHIDEFSLCTILYFYRLLHSKLITAYRWSLTLQKNKIFHIFNSLKKAAKDIKTQNQTTKDAHLYIYIPRLFLIQVDSFRLQGRCRVPLGNICTLVEPSAWHCCNIIYKARGADVPSAAPICIATSAFTNALRVCNSRGHTYYYTLFEFLLAFAQRVYCTFYPFVYIYIRYCTYIADNIGSRRSCDMFIAPAN